MVEIANAGKLRHQLKSGTKAFEAQLVDKSQNAPTVVKELTDEEVTVTGKEQKLFSIQLDKSVERIEWRKKRHGNTSNSQENSPHLELLLAEYHDIFSLEEGERGGTDWIKFEIDTGNELP